MIAATILVIRNIDINMFSIHLDNTLSRIWVTYEYTPKLNCVMWYMDIVRLHIHLDMECVSLDVDTSE